VAIGEWARGGGENPIADQKLNTKRAEGYILKWKCKKGVPRCSGREGVALAVETGGVLGAPSLKKEKNYVRPAASSENYVPSKDKRKGEVLVGRGAEFCGCEKRSRYKELRKRAGNPEKGGDNEKRNGIRIKTKGNGVFRLGVAKSGGWGEAKFARGGRRERVGLNRTSME